MTLLIFRGSFEPMRLRADQGGEHAGEVARVMRPARLPWKKDGDSLCLARNWY